MKKLKILVVLASTILLFSWSGKAQNENLNDKNPANKVEVIDFHSTHRCMTCNAIEANTKFTLKKYFAEELKAGTVTFQSFNVDEKENYAMAEKFEASGTSLYLNVIADGKHTQINLTNFAFKKGKDKEAFSQELKKKIEKQLSSLE